MGLLRAWKTEARARRLSLLETHVRGGRHGTSSRWCVPFACSLCAIRVDVADAGDASRASPGRRVVGARNQPGFQARAYVLGLDGTEARARRLSLLETHVRGGRHGTSSRWCVPFACSLCAIRVDVADAGDASRASPGRRVVGARNQPGFQARAYVLGLDGTETWRAGARRRAASIVTRAMASRRVVSARSSPSPRLHGRTARRSSPSLPSIRGFLGSGALPHTELTR